MNEISDIAALRVSDNAQIHPVILSGGSGTRLWPLSRTARPKQFLALASDRTLIQETALRGFGDVGFAPPIVSCNDEHRFMIDDQLREIGITPRCIMLEPAGRNTAPALAAVALWLIAHDPDAVMLIQPSDHLIGSVDEFYQAVAVGLPAAQAGYLVTFGVKPTRAETGYGYILAGTHMDETPGVHAVARFVEKPDAEAAQRFLESQVCYWNSGIFLFKAQQYLDEVATFHPHLLDACRRAVDQGAEDLGFFRLDQNAFNDAPKLSIDRAVMEHTERAVVVPVDMAWNDIGSWRTLREVGDQDEKGNVTNGDVILEDSANCYVRSERPLVVAIGMEEVVIVATDDVVLVAAADRASEIGNVLEKLNERNRPEPIRHTTVHRPWGYYQTTDSGERFQVKRLMVKPGAKLSLQKHCHRAEHWVVVQGTALVQRGHKTKFVYENESIYIPIGTQHRLENPGKVPLYLIEVQSGAYLGEDDIVRFSDSYGRN